MSGKVMIRVEERDLDSAINLILEGDIFPRSCNCPVGQAIKRAIPLSLPQVTLDVLCDLAPKGVGWMKAPEKIRDFVELFDSNRFEDARMLLPIEFEWLPEGK